MEYRGASMKHLRKVERCGSFIALGDDGVGYICFRWGIGLGYHKNRRAGPGGGAGIGIERRFYGDEEGS